MKRSFRDDDGFLRVLHEHHDDLARFARSLTRNTEDAKDLVADTILKAYESWDSVREEGAMKTYLFRIAHRIHMRQVKRRRLFLPFSKQETLPHDASLEHASIATHHYASPEHITDATLVREALQRLPPLQKEFLVLVDILGWSIDEVVAVHGGTIAAAKSTLHRSRQHLRKLMLDKGERNER